MYEIAKIIDLAGGPERVAARTERTPDAVARKWPKHGIPDRHWSALIELAGENGHTLTPLHLYEANRTVRESAKMRLNNRSARLLSNA